MPPSMVLELALFEKRTTCSVFQGCSRIGSDLAGQVAFGYSKGDPTRPDPTRPDPTGEGLDPCWPYPNRADPTRLDP